MGLINEVVPGDLLDAVLADANWSPSWSNTQPYRIAIASGDLAQRLKGELCERFDLAMKAQQGGLLGKLKLLATRKGQPDGDFATNFAYPADLQPRRRATGHGLYELLGIARHDKAARNRQMRRNFEFFGAPTVIFVFAHQGLREFSILDAGIFLQTLMLSAQAHGLVEARVEEAHGGLEAEEGHALGEGDGEAAGEDGAGAAHGGLSLIHI